MEEIYLEMGYTELERRCHETICGGRRLDCKFFGSRVLDSNWGRLCAGGPGQRWERGSKNMKMGLFIHLVSHIEITEWGCPAIENPVATKISPHWKSRIGSQKIQRAIKWVRCFTWLRDNFSWCTRPGFLLWGICHSALPLGFLYLVHCLQGASMD